MPCSAFTGVRRMTIQKVMSLINLLSSMFFFFVYVIKCLFSFLQKIHVCHRTRLNEDWSSQMCTEEAAHVSDSTEAREFQHEVLTRLSVLGIVQQQQGEWLTALPTRCSVKETDKAPEVVVGYAINWRRLGCKRTSGHSAQRKELHAAVHRHRPAAPRGRSEAEHSLELPTSLLPTLSTKLLSQLLCWPVEGLGQLSHDLRFKANAKEIFACPEARSLQTEAGPVHVGTVRPSLMAPSLTLCTARS
ncbi:uncharacterized protein [Dermacentor andersoni]|uniref:uncharacterized protein isoform X1 n=3 Tax=Dermacentor andersoni TaxID=34620 RepID=UPI002417167D|nr:uncharacterized protein LOC126530053 isoform X1 [Dermacentor andersoni]